MKNWIGFAEIPVSDFRRAVKFYEGVFGVKLAVCDECPREKMAFFPCGTQPQLALSWTEGFRPSADGVLLHLPVESIGDTLSRVEAQGGRVVRGKTRIEAEGMGCFALFRDPEGNTLGLHARE